MTVADLYRHTVLPMPAADRLRLAAMILNDIPDRAVVDYNEEWSEEDLREFRNSGWTAAEEG